MKYISERPYRRKDRRNPLLLLSPWLPLLPLTSDDVSSTLHDTIDIKRAETPPQTELVLQMFLLKVLPTAVPSAIIKCGADNYVSHTTLGYKKAAHSFQQTILPFLMCLRSSLNLIKESPGGVLIKVVQKKMKVCANLRLSFP